MVIYFSSFFGFISLFFDFISLIFFHAFLTRCPKVVIPSPLTYNSMNINRFIKSIITTHVSEKHCHGFKNQWFFCAKANDEKKKRGIMLENFPHRYRCRVLISFVVISDCFYHFFPGGFFVPGPHKWF